MPIRNSKAAPNRFRIEFEDRLIEYVELRQLNRTIYSLLAKGKQDHGMRTTVKDREWAVEKQRTVRHRNR